MSPEAKQRMRAMLLSEVLTGKHRWWLVLIESDVNGVAGHHGGDYINARGPTEAWCLFHNFGFYPGQGRTVTYEIVDDKQDKVTPDLQYRLLTKFEELAVSTTDAPTAG